MAILLQDFLVALPAGLTLLLDQFNPMHQSECNKQAEAMTLCSTLYKPSTFSNVPAAT